MKDPLRHHLETGKAFRQRDRGPDGSSSACGNSNRWRRFFVRLAPRRNGYNFWKEERKKWHESIRHTPKKTAATITRSWHIMPTRAPTSNLNSPSAGKNWRHSQPLPIRSEEPPRNTARRKCGISITTSTRPPTNPYGNHIPYVGNIVSLDRSSSPSSALALCRGEMDQGRRHRRQPCGAAPFPPKIAPTSNWPSCP